MKSTAKKVSAAKQLIATVRIDSSSIKEMVDGLREEFRIKLAEVKTLMQTTGPARFTKLDANGQGLGANADTFHAIHDIRTGLIWSAKVIKANNWADAKAKAAEVQIVGAKGRLPECDELLSIVDRSVFKPAADHQFFKFLDLSDWYWSNTVYASVSSCAWNVYLGNGHCSYDPQSSLGLVLAVRSASQ